MTKDTDSPSPKKIISPHKTSDVGKSLVVGDLTINFGDSKEYEIDENGEWYEIKKEFDHHLGYKFKTKHDFNPLIHQEDILKWMDARGNRKLHNICGGMITAKMGLCKTTTFLLYAIREYQHREMRQCRINLLKRAMGDHSNNTNLDIRFGSESKNAEYKPKLGLTCISQLIDSYVHGDNILPSLIVVPKTAIMTWETELHKFFKISKYCKYNRSSELENRKDESEDEDSIKYYIAHSEYNNYKDITHDQLIKYNFIITSYEVLSSEAKKHSVYEDRLIKDQYGRICGIEPPVHLKTYEKTVKKMKGGKVLFYTLFQNVCLDESHKIVNCKTNTFYSTLSVHGKRKWCMTGTPGRNDILTDIYSQFRFLGYSDILNSKQFSIDEFTNKKLYYCIKNYKYEQAGIKLPDTHKVVEYLDFSKEENDIYDCFYNAAGKAYTQYEEKTLEYTEILTVFLRLRQICVSAYTMIADISEKKKIDMKILEGDMAESTEDKKEEEKEEKQNITARVLKKLPAPLLTWIKNKHGTAGLKSAKIKKIREIISNIRKTAPNEKIVVFTNFKRVIDLLAFAFDQDEIEYSILTGEITGKKREKAIHTFKTDKKCTVLLVTLKTGSESLNLADVANHVIISEIWWCSAVTDQAESRVARYGQKKEIYIYTLMIRNSIEERINELCIKKTNLTQEFLSKNKSGALEKDKNYLDVRTMGKLLGVKKARI